jgi:acetyl-CoA acetyltransferase
MTNTEVAIVAAVRTPFGRYFGGLSTIRPDDLLGATLRELADRTPELDLNKVDDVIILGRFLDSPLTASVGRELKHLYKLRARSGLEMRNL